MVEGKPGVDYDSHLSFLKINVKISSCELNVLSHPQIIIFKLHFMLRVNLTHFSFCVDQSTGYPFFFFMKFGDFSSSRVMNWFLKSGHFDV